MLARLAISNLRQFQRELESADRERKRAANIAVRVEAFRLRNKLKQEIRAGSPGGNRFEPLSVIAGATKPGRNTPLRRMATAVRYWVTPQGYSVGFNGGELRTMSGDYRYQKKRGDGPTARNRLSKSWIYLAKLHQGGGRVRLPEIARALFRRVGQDLKKRGRGNEARFFFLKKTTTHVDLPARDIVDPFWQANRAQAARNIVNNFKRKMRGERI